LIYTNLFVFFFFFFLRVVVGVYKQDFQIEKKTIQVKEKCQEVDLKFDLVNDDPTSEGVLRVTAFEIKGEKEIPRAERLVFRKSSRRLKLEIEMGKKNFVPGEEVNFRVKATDDKGFPTQGYFLSFSIFFFFVSYSFVAVIGICVSDDAVLNMVQKRKQVPRLPVMVNFENQVDHLEDAHVYLDPKNPIANLACDLLLGTQGWRRFAFFRPFITTAGQPDGAKNQAQAQRVLCRFKPIDITPESTISSDISESDYDDSDSFEVDLLAPVVYSEAIMEIEEEEEEFVKYSASEEADQPILPPEPKVEEKDKKAPSQARRAMEEKSAPIERQKKAMPKLEQSIEPKREEIERKEIEKETIEEEREVAAGKEKEEIRPKLSLARPKQKKAKKKDLKKKTSPFASLTNFFKKKRSERTRKPPSLSSSSEEEIALPLPISSSSSLLTYTRIYAHKNTSPPSNRSDFTETVHESSFAIYNHLILDILAFRISIHSPWSLLKKSSSIFLRYK